MAFTTSFLLAGILYLIPNPSDTHASVTPIVTDSQPASTLAEPRIPQPTATKQPGTPSTLSEWDMEVTVRSGDSLSTIFKRLGLGGSIPALLRLGTDAKPLHRLRPGQILHIRRDDQGLRHLMYRPTLTRESHYQRTPDGTYAVNHVDLTVEYRRRTVSGTINRTLFEAGDDAGLNPTMILELAHIFGWDIDFALDIRKGDQFKLVWDEHWIQGRHARNGPIVAAEFISQGQMHRALRYAKPRGRADYYTPDGKPLRKQFLRTPVDFTRISSRFNPRRLHPILKRFRPHRGVDYAAPTGTPVYAAGDGSITRRSWKGGYGRVIFIRHGTRYTTVYAHLSRYARGLKVGSKVTQGQIIGRVGRSGTATGPHLHYEFRVDGVHRNPVKVTLPPINLLQYAELADFRQQTWPLLVALGAPSNLRTAYANVQ